VGGRAGIPIAGEKAQPYLGWQRGKVIGVPHFDERFQCNLLKCEKKMTFTGLLLDADFQVADGLGGAAAEGLEH
jgi:hypothetical protein